MKWQNGDTIFSKSILTSVSSPLEELVLEGFDFGLQCECVYNVCVHGH